MLEQMRRRVERGALKAGRQDILDQLPTVTDSDQLDQWLAELE
jgi:hypothetical protein